jgi:hypothetical protein
MTTSNSFRLREDEKTGLRYIEVGDEGSWTPICRVDFACSHLPEAAEQLVVDMIGAANLTLAGAALIEEAGL